MPKTAPRALCAAAVACLALATACSPTPAPAAAAAQAAADPEAPEMARGMDLLNRQSGFAASTVFRGILGRNPTHYGAQYQLARALDLAGYPVEARAEWTRALTAAEGYSDTASVRVIQARLARPDTLSQEQLMARGLHLLYDRAEYPAAVEEFRAVLARNPTHYGAHYQLATALEGAGNVAEARSWWTRMLAMAEQIKDQPTVEHARGRLEATR